MWWRKKDKVEKLIPKLVFWKPKTVRREAIRALGTIGDTRAVKPLIKALRSWNEDIRNEAIGALIKIGTPSVELLIRTLLQTLQSAYITTFWPGMEKTVIKTLVEIGVPAIKPLIKIFIENKNLYVQWIVADALGKIGDARAIRPLIEALRHRDLGIRMKATEALGRIGDPLAVDSLIDTVLRDQFYRVRENAAEALGRIGHARAAEPLIMGLNDQNIEVRKTAKEALMQIGFQAVEPLVKELGHDKPDIRVQVTLILEHIGWTPKNDVERTNYLVAKGNIETVLFGQGMFQWFDENLILLDPDVSKLIIPIAKLKWIEIYPATYDFHHVERFITYAINYIGQKHLKEHVKVHIYGDPERLHPNLRNSLENLCKQVEVHEGE